MVSHKQLERLAQKAAGTMGVDMASGKDFTTVYIDPEADPRIINAAKCSYCLRRPAIKIDEKERPICLTCHHAKPSPIVRQGEFVGRNQPCPCGSGKKYKRCCRNTKDIDKDGS